jgi:hypothetical protein
MRWHRCFWQDITFSEDCLPEWDTSLASTGLRRTRHPTDVPWLQGSAHQGISGEFPPIKSKPLWDKNVAARTIDRAHLSTQSAVPAIVAQRPIN